MRTLIVAAAAVLTTACAGGLQSNAPEPRVYRLVAPSLEPGSGLPVDLVVLRPSVHPGLGTERIATLWPGNRLDYFAGARWSSELGPVVQAAAVESLATGGRLRSVQGEPARFGATHVLGLEIRRFEADYTAGAPPLARVVMAATIARQAERRPLGKWTVGAEVPARANTLTEVTAALDRAFGKVMTDLMREAQSALAADAGAAR